MPAVRRYFTGLLTESHERKHMKSIGRGWEASISRARTANENGFDGNSREIVITAASAGKAQNALNLIKTVHELIEGSSDMFGGDFNVIPFDQAECRQMYPNNLLGWPTLVKMSGFPEACQLAAKASQKRKHSYAIALYHVSQKLHANHPMDLHFDLRSREIRSAEHHDHVRFGYSLVAAYAVIEQLGLALNGTAFQNGNWIPEKRAELETRLKLAGVDIMKPTIWHLRGGRTTLELRRKTQPLKKAKWYGGHVRDEEVYVVDAIADLRWLRSGVAAHDVKEHAKLLSVFDVLNAQLLARRCILACLGCEKKRR
jgi:hypothetical protein